jgi:ribulose-phosphate 3-epimerase
MAEIVPAIIGANFQEVKTKLDQVEGLVTWAQLDIMDALFVPPYTWQNAGDLEDPPAGGGGKTKLELHLMVEQPEEIITDWLTVVDRIIVHLEATDKIKEIADQLAGSPVELGVALKLETPIEAYDEWAGLVKFVQLMSIAKAGYHGEQFDERVLPKVVGLRTKYPSVTIAIDGGVNLLTGQQAIAAGADVLVVGSTLWDSANLAEQIEKFKKL